MKLRVALTVTFSALLLSCSAMFTSKDSNGRKIKGLMWHNCRGRAEKCATDSWVRGRASSDSMVRKIHDVMATGDLDCSELFDHPTTWTFDLDGQSSLTARRESFNEGYGGHYTWCGTDIKDVFSSICATWHESLVGQSGDQCDATSFVLNVRQHKEGGLNNEFRSLATRGRGVKNGDGDQTHNVAIYKVDVQFKDEAHLDLSLLSHLQNFDQVSADMMSGDVVSGDTDNGGTKPEDPIISESVAGDAMTGDAMTGDAFSYQSTCTQYTYIDMMVAYTPAVEARYGGQMQTLATISSMYSLFNTTYANMGLPQIKVRVVWAGKVNYVGTNMGGDLAALYNALNVSSGQGIFSGMTTRQVRTLVAPDIVQLVTESTDYCGMALSEQHQPASSTFGQFSYAAVSYSCLSYYSHIHEAGHLQTLDHDKSNAGQSTGYTFGQQWCVSGGFRTIMAYACTSGVGVPRVMVLSSPNITYAGIATGTATTDNVRALTEAYKAFSNNMASKWGSGPVCVTTTSVLAVYTSTTLQQKQATSSTQVVSQVTLAPLQQKESTLKPVTTTQAARQTSTQQLYIKSSAAVNVAVVSTKQTTQVPGVASRVQQPQKPVVTLAENRGSLNQDGALFETLQGKITTTDDVSAAVIASADLRNGASPPNIVDAGQGQVSASTNTGAIVGSVIGVAVALIAMVVVAVRVHQVGRRKQESVEDTVGGDVTQTNSNSNTATQPIPKPRTRRPTLPEGR